MDFSKQLRIPRHMEDGRGLPRSQEERFLLIRRRIEQGYYDTDRIKRAVAEAFLDPPQVRRAGEQAYPAAEG